MTIDALDRDRATAALTDDAADARPLIAVGEPDLAGWLDRQSADHRAWLEAAGFKAKAGEYALLAEADGRPGPVVVGLGDRPRSLWALAALPARLPVGSYRLAEHAGAPPDAAAATRMALGWALGSYRFARYRPQAEVATLQWPESADREAVSREATATQLVRDLVNTPTNDMGPADLEAAARALADAFGAEARSVVGWDLLDQGYPAIHAVGRAASSAPADRLAPRLIELGWGDPSAPLVALVGKGVCFDTGGLDIKPASGMRLMKKDMGGAAHALGLAYLIMAAGLPVRLCVLLPAVENAIAADAFRPGDVLQTRKGLTVEVGNTDAEGRLILADALTHAAELEPALLIDLATLTGAARVALGPDLPAMFCTDDELAAQFAAAGAEQDDPVWRLPLWQPYRARLESKVAKLSNIADMNLGGAITAALFLQEFVADAPWIHLDIYAWNGADRPGRPAGGEAFAIRALFAVIAERYGPTPP